MGKQLDHSSLSEHINVSKVKTELHNEKAIRKEWWRIWCDTCRKGNTDYINESPDMRITTWFITSARTTQTPGELVLPKPQMATVPEHHDCI